MITWARRGGARSDVLERVTHNAAGAIIDQYTHFDWEPLCEAVGCLDYGGAAKPAALVATATPSALAAAETPAAVASRPFYGAFHGATPRRGQNHGETGWRRRESNPGPRGFQLTLVHVRSCDVPRNWVRGFGRDLASTVSRQRYQRRSCAAQPWCRARRLRRLPYRRTAQRFLGRESDCVVVRK
jgi:hypothetical protein